MASKCSQVAQLHGSTVWCDIYLGINVKIIQVNPHRHHLVMDLRLRVSQKWHNLWYIIIYFTPQLIYFSWQIIYIDKKNHNSSKNRNFFSLWGAHYHNSTLSELIFEGLMLGRLWTKFQKNGVKMLPGRPASWIDCLGW